MTPEQCFQPWLHVESLGSIKKLLTPGARPGRFGFIWCGTRLWGIESFDSSPGDCAGQRNLRMIVLESRCGQGASTQHHPGTCINADSQARLETASESAFFPKIPR